MQFLKKHYLSELFIKLQETANSGEQIFLMSLSPGGLFRCRPLLPSSGILDSLWLWLSNHLKRWPSCHKGQDGKEVSSQDAPLSPLVPPAARLLKRG